MKQTLAVIMPCFNTRPDHLRAAVESVEVERHKLHAIGTRLELVVVDDKSTDTETIAGLGALTSSFHWARVIRLEKNRGAGHARNVALAKTDASLLAFLDSDDYWLAGGMTKLCAELLSNETNAWVAGDIYLQMGDLARDERSLFFQYPSRLRYLGEAFDLGRPIRLRRPVEAFLEGSLCGMGSFVVRRSVFDEAGAFDPGLRKGDDTELYWRLGRIADLVFVPQPTLVYRRHPGTTTSDGRPLAEWEPPVLYRMLEEKAWREHRGAIRRRLLRTQLNLSSIYGNQRAARLAIAHAMKAVGIAPLSPTTWTAAAGSVLRCIRQ